MNNLETERVKGKQTKKSEKITSGPLEDGQEGGEKAYQRLLKRAALSKARGEREEALACYEMLVHWRLTRRPFVKDVPPLEFFKDVLEPALRMGDELWKKNPTDLLLVARAAKLYAAKGRLLLDAPYEQWTFKKSAFRESADASARAIDLYPHKDDPVMASFYANHGFALAALKPVDMETIRKDWERALQADGKHLWGLALKAHYYYYRAVCSAPYSSDLIKQAKEAIRTYDEAITLGLAKGEQKEFLTFCHWSKGNLYVLLANNRFRDARDAQIAKDLQMAEKEALSAIQFSPENEKAWAVLGNAREDLAWSALGKDKAYYPKAIFAFENQKKFRPGDPQGNVNEARAYIQWAEDEPGRKGDNLAKAQRELSDALQKSPGHVEGNYWQGKLFWLQEQKGKALRAYAKALSHPTQGRTWLYSIRGDLKDNEKDWQDLFAILLRGKKRAEYGPADAPVLLLRYEVFAGIPAFVRKDLETDNPQLIADASDAARLAEDPHAKATGYARAANARLLAYAQTKKKTYRDRALEDVRQIFKFNDHIAGRGGWARIMARQLEAQALEAKGQPGRQIKLYKEAIHFAQIAIDEADPREKQDWRRYKKMLLNQLEGFDD